MENIPVEVWQIARDDEGHEIVLLRDAQGRLLTISIGVCEAAAIWVALSQERNKPYVRRPWSHDLMQAMLDRLDARLQKVVIDNYSNDVFYATLHIFFRGEELLIDARPSDAIALLLRMSAPLYVNADVMNENAIMTDGNRNMNDDMPQDGDGLV